MPRSEIEKIQLEKLKKTAVYCYENVKLYKDKFDKDADAWANVEDSYSEIGWGQIRILTNNL